MTDRNDESSGFGSERRTDVASGRSGPNVMLIAFGLIAAIFLVFFLQNGERTSIDFLVFEKRTTIRWSIIVAMLLGIVLDRAFAVWWRRRAKRNK